jgi:hypothetical protein
MLTETSPVAVIEFRVSAAASTECMLTASTDTADDERIEASRACMLTVPLIDEGPARGRLQLVAFLSTENHLTKVAKTRRMK